MQPEYLGIPYQLTQKGCQEMESATALFGFQDEQRVFEAALVYFQRGRLVPTEHICLEKMPWKEVSGHLQLDVLKLMDLLDFWQSPDSGASRLGINAFWIGLPRAQKMAPGLPWWRLGRGGGEALFSQHREAILRHWFGDASSLLTANLVQNREPGIPPESGYYLLTVRWGGEISFVGQLPPLGGYRNLRLT